MVDALRVTPEMIKLMDRIIEIRPELSLMPKGTAFKVLLFERMAQVLKEEHNLQHPQHNAPLTQQLLCDFFDLDIVDDADNKFIEIS